MTTRSAKSMNDKYKFGTNAEVANRDADKGGFDPESHAPAFVQTKPGNTGSDLAYPGNGTSRGNGTPCTSQSSHGTAQLFR